MQVVKDIQIKIPREEVLRLLKHKADITVIDKKISELINKLIDEGKKLADSKAVFGDYIVKSIENHSVVLEGTGYSLLGKSTSHHLYNSKKVTLFVATIGSNLEKKIQEFIKDESMANAAILDAVGSAAVESVVNYINEFTNRRAEETGFKTVQRFSPGYGDWDLKEQKGLLQLLNAPQVGVTLTSAHLMQPEKSVSGVIGWVK